MLLDALTQSFDPAANLPGVVRREEFPESRAGVGRAGRDGAGVGRRQQERLGGLEEVEEFAEGPADDGAEVEG